MRADNVVRIAAVVLALCFFLEWGSASAPFSAASEVATYTGLDFATGIEGEAGQSALFLILVAAIVALAAPSLRSANRVSERAAAAIVAGAAVVSLGAFALSWSSHEQTIARAWFTDVDLALRFGSWGVIGASVVLGLAGLYPLLSTTNGSRVAPVAGAKPGATERGRDVWPAAGAVLTWVMRAQVLVLAACAVLVALGSVGPWSSAFGVMTYGFRHDGPIALALGLLAALALLATRFRWFSVLGHWIMVAAFAGAAVLGVYDWLNLSAVSGTRGLGIIEMEWGLPLMMFAAMAGAVIALLHFQLSSLPPRPAVPAGARGARPSRPIPATGGRTIERPAQPPPPPLDASMVTTLVSLADGLAEQGQIASAMVTYRQALANLPDDHPLASSVAQRLAALQER